MSTSLTIAPGMRVDVELVARNKTREQLQLVLVGDAAADFDKGFVGLGTPLAQALLGHTVGETLPYARGDIVQLKILGVHATDEAPDADAAEQRDESLRRARDKAELTSMVSFALTFDSKWGAYDPEQIVANFEKKEEARAPGDVPTDEAPANDVPPDNRPARRRPPKKDEP